MLLHYLVKVETPKMHVTTTSAFNVNFKIAVTCIKSHWQFHKMFWWIRACVQSVNPQHAHMISCRRSRHRSNQVCILQDVDVVNRFIHALLY